MQLPEPSPRSTGDPIEQTRAELAEIRAQLTDFAARVGRAFDTLAERDRRIVDAMNQRVREHGELVAHETARISAAMQAYVQQGVAAIGQLSGNIQEQVQAISAGDQIQAKVREAIDEQARYLLEHLQLMHDRIGMEARDQLALIHGLEGRTDERIMGLAKLVRSDSEALRDRIGEVAAEQSGTVAQALEERLDRVGDALTGATRWMVEELTRRTTSAMQAELERVSSELSERMSSEMAERLEAGRIDADDALERALESKIVRLARLIRSDNERLGSQLAADQEASKQALRAAKELQASLPPELMEGVDRRFETLAESLRSSHEKLASRVDRMAAKVGERYDDDLKVVIDRMGDAMHALASLGRTDLPSAPDRLDLD